MRAPRESNSIAPWLTVASSFDAVEWYKAAFGAVEMYRFDGPDRSVVARLSIGGAQFWVGDKSAEHGNFSPDQLGGSTVRIIYETPDPDTVFAQAVAAGASEVYPVDDAHGWRIGRVRDPYGHHWEICRELAG